MLKEPVPCKNPKIVETMSHQNRSISKDWLKPSFRLGKYHCAWCWDKELPKGRKKYCSDDCVVTSDAWCNPNTSSYSFYWLMERQHWKCESCKHDWAPAFNYTKQYNLMLARRKCYYHFNVLKTGRFSEYHTGALKDDIKEYFKIKRLPPQYAWNTSDHIRRFHREKEDGHEPETDHIIPVALGGMAVGFDNVQLICHSCHKEKTKRDMIEIRALRFRERQAMMENN